MTTLLPSTSPASIWKDRGFYRGIVLVPILEVIGFVLMVLIEPPSQVGFVLQIIFAGLLLMTSLIIYRRSRRFGLGIIVGWVVFVLFPVVWVLILGFSGNLM